MYSVHKYVYVVCVYHKMNVYEHAYEDQRPKLGVLSITFHLSSQDNRSLNLALPD